VNVERTKLVDAYTRTCDFYVFALSRFQSADGFASRNELKRLVEYAQDECFHAFEQIRASSVVDHLKT
jgi:hypothetical protein